MPTELKFDKLLITSDLPLTAEHSLEAEEEGIVTHTVTIHWNPAEEAADSTVFFSINLPVKNAKFKWNTGARMDKSLNTTWQGGANTDNMLAHEAPVFSFIDSDDTNVYTFALNEVKRRIHITAGYEEGHNPEHMLYKVSIPFSQLVAMDTYTLKLRIDTRKLHLAKVLDSVRIWWEKILNIKPMQVPDCSKKPMYSTWYSYQKMITDEKIEAECALAKDLGMDTVIVDDGWQCDETRTGYKDTGDWNVMPSKIKDMKAHVQKVHDLGMKYMLWFSVPFVGFDSEAYQQFKDKLLYLSDHFKAGILDPRYPEVRQHLIDKYVYFVKEYGVDSFKLDFIDTFYIQNEPPKTEGMDYVCVCDAVERLMTDVQETLTALNPEMMIEFRQRYIGPLIRQFGNIFRVADCARNGIMNRISIADLRMLSGNTAIHSDMIIWNVTETVEDAAWQLLNSIFGVIQYSVKIEELPEDHLKMSRFWLDFSIRNRDLLFNSEFIPHGAWSQYPWIEVFNDSEALITVYANNTVMKAPMDRKTTLINATTEKKVYLESENAGTYAAISYDCMGNVVSESEISLIKGVNILPAEKSGLVVLEPKHLL